MTVDLSPLTASRLLRAVRKDSATVNPLSRCLEENGLDIEWLKAVEERYSRRWESAVAGGYDADVAPVTEQLGYFVSYICLALRPASSELFSGQLLQDVLVEYRRTTGLSDASLPLQHRVGLYGWIVGRPVGDVDRWCPAALPTELLALDVRQAYDGLIEHSSAQSRSWTELERTAVLWRFAGLMEGLQDVEGPREALKALAFSVRSSVPDLLYAKVTDDDWLRSFLSDRNALTHIRPTDGLGFSHALSRNPAPSSLIVYLQAASYLTSGRIAIQLLDLPEGRVSGFIERVDEDSSW